MMEVQKLLSNRVIREVGRDLSVSRRSQGAGGDIVIPTFEFSKVLNNDPEGRVSMTKLGFGVCDKVSRNVAWDQSIGIGEMVELPLLHSKQVT